MAREHEGGIIVPTGFRIENPSPIDDRLVVKTLGDLTSSVALPNVYGGILVAVSESNYDLFKWNGNDRTDFNNWSAFSGSSTGVGGSSDTSISASFASSSISSSFASTASFTLISVSSSFASTAETASHALSTLSSTSASFALTASHVLNLDISSLSGITQSFDGNRNITNAQIPGLFNINPYINAYEYFNEDSSSISDFLEAVFYPPNPNLPPIIKSSNQVSINEFNPSASSVHFILAEDQPLPGFPDALDLVTTFRTQSTYTDDFFRIDDPTIGEITLNTIATASMNAPGGQHTDGDSHQFYYEVGDSRGAFTKETLFIRIIPDAKPEFTTDNDPITGLLTTINEFNDIGSFVAKIEGTDVENGVTFRISSNNTDGFFNIDSDTGIITPAVKPLRSMNTDPSTGAYPLDIEIVDQFNQSTLRTFFIKIKPNTAPIFKLNSVGGNSLIINHGLVLNENTSGPGVKQTIFAVNSTELPFENDSIIIETGSDVPNAFKNDFDIEFRNTDNNFIGGHTPTPSIVISQIANALNPDVTPQYQFFLTASDKHHQSGDDTNDPTFLNFTITVTDNLDPIMDPATQSLNVNEFSEDPTNVSTVGYIFAEDLDNSENPFIANLTLKGAFFQNGGFPSFNIDTNNYLPNLTESLGGTSNLDPHSNPFQKNNPLTIERKPNIILNSDVANLYEYEITLGGGNKGILQIRIDDHQIDNTFSINWDETPYIIESALTNDNLKVDEKGFNGIDAQISFNSGISHTYTISSSNDFIETPPPGSTAELKLKKPISESFFTSVNSSQSLNNTIELEITASQTNFPTSFQSYKYIINISPNNGPDLEVNKISYSTNHTPVGAIAGTNILAHIGYSDPDTEGDHPNFETGFTFEGDNLTTSLNTISKRYEIRSISDLSIGEYPFTASLKDTHGFISSSVQDVIIIGEANAPVFNTNATSNHESVPGISKPLFFVLETAIVDNIRGKVVKESHGQPVNSNQAFLNIVYNTPQESNNPTTNFIARVEGDSEIFLINNTTGFISVGSGFAGKGYAVNDIVEVSVEYISNQNFSRFETIFIKITDNTPPNADIILTPNLFSTVSAGTTLLSINPSNISTQTNEGDTIKPPNIIITGSDNVPISLFSSSENNNFIVKNIDSITTATPQGSNYNTVFSSNGLNGTFIFYVVEGAQSGDNVVVQSDGVSSGFGQTQANVSVTYESVDAQNYNYKFNLLDTANQFNEFEGNITVSPPIASFVSFAITPDDGTFSKFNIDSNGNITVGASFDYTFNAVNDSDEIPVTITATDSYGNSATQNITIIITQNHAPTLNTELLVFPQLTSPVPQGSDLIEILGGAIDDAQNDTVTIKHTDNIGPGGGVPVNIPFPFTENTLSPPYNSKLKLQNQNEFSNPTPGIDEYSATISSNANIKFYINETATQGTNVVTDTGGVGGDIATITVNYTNPPADIYPFNIELRDDANQQSTHPGTISVDHPAAIATIFTVTTTPPNQFQITSINNLQATLSAGSGFQANASNVLASIKITNSYGHIHEDNVTIDIAPNQPPNFSVTPSNPQLPITTNTTLLTINGIGDPEGHTIGTPTVTITKASNGDNMALNSPSGNTANGYTITKLAPNTEAGVYNWSVTMTDQHGASRTKTSTDVGESQLTIIQESPTVRFYKADIGAGNSDLLDFAFMGFSDGTLDPSLPAGTIEGSVLDHFETEEFSTDTTGISVSAGFQGNKTLKFISQINLDTISDFSTQFGANNGISQLGQVTLNNERLIIVFPSNPTQQGIADVPNVMLDNLPGSGVNAADTYFLWTVLIDSSLLGGNQVFNSNILSFTKTTDNRDYKILYLEQPTSGVYKFYLLPDEYNNTLPNS